MVEKDMEEGLAKIDDKEGTIADIEVKEVSNTHGDLITLRIKRRRKIKGSNKNILKDLPMNE